MMHEATSSLISLSTEQQRRRVSPASTSVPVESKATTSHALRSSSSSTSSAANRWLSVLFFLIVGTCALSLMSVASIIQHQDGDRPHMRRETLDNDQDQALVLFNHLGHPRQTEDPTVSPLLQMTTPPSFHVKPRVEERWRGLGDDLSQYECVAWRQTGNCTPDGELEPHLDQPCDAKIANGVSGFCELQHKLFPNKRVRVMQMHCDSLRAEVEFTCGEFYELLTYGRQAPLYEHDRNFSLENCQTALQGEHLKAVGKIKNETDEPMDLSFVQWPSSYARGIAIVVFESVLESVYASIRSLRSMRCDLPIELWYAPEETNVTHPILMEMIKHGVYMREIRDARASRFYTKNYAVFYSAFDQVLLLDADNFAVRDPTYLFETREFMATGAMFWPDFWRPKKSIFNIQPRSFVWDVLDLDAVNMFEQESGQVLVNRRRHVKAMNAMMYYAFHPNLLERMRLVWGDKDLFRFAWLKTNSTFHMIAMPPGSAGAKLPDKNIFCGVTMVQHDPSMEIVFLHRNQEKLSSKNHRAVWRDIQQFKKDGVSIEQYDVRGANGGRYFPQFKRCYGKDIYYEDAFTMTPVANSSFATLENQLLIYVSEAANITSGATRP